MVSRRLAFYLAADLSLAAAAIHALLAPEHLNEGFEYGAFFIAAAAAQGAYAIVLVRQPQRMWLFAGIAGNLAIIALYFLTRMVGIPVGPLAGEREPVALVDVASKMAESSLVMLLVVIASWAPAEGPEAAVPQAHISGLTPGVLSRESENSVRSRSEAETLQA